MASTLPALLILLFFFSHDNAVVHCYQYKVGDLDSWGLPTPSNPHVYSFWSQKHHFQIGDSFLFLYPPSEDSVVQVTDKAFNGCDIADPILKMDDGNSHFNLTAPGNYFFTSGVPGHCDKYQKLAVSVLFANGSAGPFSADGGAASAASPSSSYPVVFGPTTSPPSSSPALRSSFLAVGLGAFGLVFGLIGRI